MQPFKARLVWAWQCLYHNIYGYNGALENLMVVLLPKGRLHFRQQTQDPSKLGKTWTAGCVNQEFGIMQNLENWTCESNKQNKNMVQVKRTKTILPFRCLFTQRNIKAFVYYIYIQFFGFFFKKCNSYYFKHLKLKVTVKFFRRLFKIC